MQKGRDGFRDRPGERESTKQNPVRAIAEKIGEKRKKVDRTSLFSRYDPVRGGEGAGGQSGSSEPAGKKDFDKIAKIGSIKQRKKRILHTKEEEVRNEKKKIMVSCTNFGTDDLEHSNLCNDASQCKNQLCKRTSCLAGGKCEKSIYDRFFTRKFGAKAPNLQAE
jgi:hypothetical protein